MVEVTNRTVKEPHAATVVRCYDLLHLCLNGGVSDFTDGKYEGVRSHAYEQAQAGQAEFLLDELHCVEGTRILDIGCGYGRILRHAKRRGIHGTGITISPPQVAECLRRGLDVRLINYREIPDVWRGKFDGIVANGSLEHFVQIEDVLSGQEDQVYREMFEICRKLVSHGKRMVTTAIHFRQRGQFIPQEIARGPDAWPVGSDRYHFTMLRHNFGGWYPEPGQLERCAEGCFRLVSAEDGTEDYRLTSEAWLRKLRSGLATRPNLWRELWKVWRCDSRTLRGMLRCLLWDQSWMWQFRGQPAPMVLWRQTWEAV